ncbi:MAG: ABC transporter permease [Thermoplasmatales archaeon]|nr:ABC transporter permease [Thermoplasmatales archaeon]MCW6170128.1 ABC transporter permease [Thermoplasmatales archaeon]
MKPIIYEIRRTLTSKFVVIMIVAIVGLSALLAYESASTYSPVHIPTTPHVTYGYYENGSNLVLVSYSHNAYGNPSSKIKVDFEYNGTFYSSISGASGFANSTIPIGNSVLPVIYVNYTYKTFGHSFSTPQMKFTIDTTNKSSGLEVISGIYDSSNTTRYGVQLFYVGSNGSTAPPLNIYFINSTNNINQSLKNSSFKYSVEGFTVKNIFPIITTPNVNETYYVVAKNSSGATILPLKKIGPLTDYVPMTQSSLQSLVFAGTSELLGFLIPILAVFAAYLTYGKDRTSGVLESVLKRPVTRGSLISSRFASNVISIFVAVGLSMIISDVIIFHYFGMYLSMTFDLYFVWQYLVEGVAFLALVYMFSHLAKSQGALLGAAIAVFVVMDLFWSIIPVAILSALNISSSSTTYIWTSIGFNYASPAGYSSLIQTMFTSKFGLISSQVINPSEFGIVAPVLIIAGILWMVVPFAISFFLAKYRD